MIRKLLVKLLAAEIRAAYLEGFGEGIEFATDTIRQFMVEASGDPLMAERLSQLEAARRGMQ